MTPICNYWMLSVSGVVMESDREWHERRGVKKLAFLKDVLFEWHLTGFFPVLVLSCFADNNFFLILFFFDIQKKY